MKQCVWLNCLFCTGGKAGAIKSKLMKSIKRGQQGPTRLGRLIKSFVQNGSGGNRSSSFINKIMIFMTLLSDSWISFIKIQQPHLFGALRVIALLKYPWWCFSCTIFTPSNSNLLLRSLAFMPGTQSHGYNCLVWDGEGDSWEGRRSKSDVSLLLIYFCFLCYFETLPSDQVIEDELMKLNSV